MRIHKNPRFLEFLLPEALWRVDTQEKDIYLSFDDGPIPELTPKVLEILAEYEAKATFFCVGDNVRKHPAIFKAVVEGGHAVGNHSYHHVNGWKTSFAQYLEEVKSCSEVMAAQGQQSVYYRPPYGKMTLKQWKAVKDLGLKVVMWDVLTADYDQSFAKEACLEVAKTKTTKGSIVVFHDNLKATENMLFALPKMLAYFHTLGYHFKKLP